MDTAQPPADQVGLEEVGQARLVCRLARTVPPIRAVAAVQAVADLHLEQAGPAPSSSPFRGSCNGTLR